MTESSTAELCARVLQRDRRALARAATLVEARGATGSELVRVLYPHTGNALVIGITGPSGAGKSTLVDQLAKSLRREEKTVGILAVDPSSPYTRGAILGDRIRMQDHHADPGVFIRSMATRGQLGGLASATLAMTLLLDAAGTDVILVETVGVGQAEVEIAQLADVTVVVLVPGLGDDVQAIKAGIMEVADLFAINKSDRPGAEQLEQEIRAMQSIGSDTGHVDAVPILKLVASRGEGVNELLAAVRATSEKRGKRSGDSGTWSLRLAEMVRERVLSLVSERELAWHAEQVARRLEDPVSAVDAMAVAAAARVKA